MIVGTSRLPVDFRLVVHLVEEREWGVGEEGKGKEGRLEAEVCELSCMLREFIKKKPCRDNHRGHGS